VGQYISWATTFGFVPILAKNMTKLEKQLWDECATAELAAARTHALLEKISIVAAEGCRESPGFSLADPASSAHKTVMTMKAARARCHLRGLSDEARRQAVERARELNALPPGFDIRRLPWQRQPRRGEIVDIIVPDFVGAMFSPEPTLHAAEATPGYHARKGEPSKPRRAGKKRPSKKRPSRKPKKK